MIPYIKNMYDDIYKLYREHGGKRDLDWVINNMEAATYGHRRKLNRLIKKYPFVNQYYKRYDVVFLNYNIYLKMYEKNIQKQFRLDKIKKLKQ